MPDRRSLRRRWRHVRRRVRRRWQEAVLAVLSVVVAVLVFLVSRPQESRVADVGDASAPTSSSAIESATTGEPSATSVPAPGAPVVTDTTATAAPTTSVSSPTGPAGVATTRSSPGACGPFEMEATASVDVGSSPIEVSGRVRNASDARCTSPGGPVAITIRNDDSEVAYSVDQTDSLDPPTSLAPGQSGSAVRHALDGWDPPPGRYTVTLAWAGEVEGETRFTVPG